MIARKWRKYLFLVLLWHNNEWIFVKTQRLPLVIKHLLYRFWYTNIISNIYIVWCLLLIGRVVNDLLKKYATKLRWKCIYAVWAHAKKTFYPRARHISIIHAYSMLYVLQWQCYNGFNIRTRKWSWFGRHSNVMAFLN